VSGGQNTWKQDSRPPQIVPILPSMPVVTGEHASCVIQHPPNHRNRDAITNPIPVSGITKYTKQPPEAKSFCEYLMSFGQSTDRGSFLVFMRDVTNLIRILPPSKKSSVSCV
jgi:hypothetical protein